MMVVIAWLLPEHHQIDKLYFEHFQPQNVLTLNAVEHKPNKNYNN